MRCQEVADGRVQRSRRFGSATGPQRQGGNQTSTREVFMESTEVLIGLDWGKDTPEEGSA